MAHPLAGCRAKIDRTVDQINTLNPELVEFYNSKPINLEYEVEGGENGGLARAVFRVESMREPPQRFGVVAGELVHNLRSALDHLVSQLALLQTDDPSDRLQFPIYESSPRDWQTIAADRLTDVPEAAVDLIESQQPFHRDTSERVRGHALAVVRALSNEDKHRVILEPTTAGAAPEQGDVKIVPGADVGTISEIEVYWGVALVPDQCVVTVHFERTGPVPELRWEGRVPVDVGFGAQRFRAANFPGLAGEIFRTIKKFAHFFPAEGCPFAETVGHRVR
jgi:hypothetical protein